MQTETPKSLMDDIKSAREKGGENAFVLLARAWRENPGEFRIRFTLSMVGYLFMAIAICHEFSIDGLLFLIGLVLNHSMRKPS
jgi:hypothetical protein